MLCYNDKKKVLADKKFNRFFCKMIDRNTVNNKVQCSFTGYEIVKKGTPRSSFCYYLLMYSLHKQTGLVALRPFLIRV